VDLPRLGQQSVGEFLERLDAGGTSFEYPVLQILPRGIPARLATIGGEVPLEIGRNGGNVYPRFSRAFAPSLSLFARAIHSRTRQSKSPWWACVESTGGWCSSVISSNRKSEQIYGEEVDGYFPARGLRQFQNLGFALKSRNFQTPTFLFNGTSIAVSESPPTLGNSSQPCASPSIPAVLIPSPMGTSM
jgi:hypothetical protein